MLDEVAARDDPVACLGEEIRGETWHGEKVMSPGLEEILMCCLCFRTVLVDKGIGLMSLSALRLSCLIGNSVYFHDHHFSHELDHPSLFNAMRTMTLAIYRGVLGFICYLICVAGMNGICLLATNMRT